jgi:hypothetical protein
MAVLPAKNVRRTCAVLLAAVSFMIVVPCCIVWAAGTPVRPIIGCQLVECIVSVCPLTVFLPRATRNKLSQTLWKKIDGFRVPASHKPALVNQSVS